MTNKIRSFFYGSNCRLVLVVLLMFIVFNEGTAVIIPELATNVAVNWLQSRLLLGQSGWSNLIKPTIGNFSLLIANDDTLAYIFPVTPSGYIAVSCYEEMSPIIAYSTSENINAESVCGFINVLRDDLICRVNYLQAIRSRSTVPPENDNGTFAIIKNRVDWRMWSETPGQFAVDYSPSIAAHAEQVGPLL